jgi:uncharacterized protein (UPF0332 family)
MALADDLLEQARHLANREPKRTKQASLRRAVSAAYYAVFHLLVSAGMANWKGVLQRPFLARGFDHFLMMQSSKRMVNRTLLPEEKVTGENLKLIARNFIELQEARHLADYDYTKKFEKTDVLKKIDMAAVAFEKWKIVRKENLAQDYLISLLIKGRKE